MGRELTVEFAAGVHGRGDDRHVLHDSQRARAPHLAQHADCRPQDAAFAAARQQDRVRRQLRTAVQARC
jgi:hypothetical protein